MNDVIFEAVVTTVAPDGTPHVAPMGVRYEPIRASRHEGGRSSSASAASHFGRVILMPFKPSTTYDNIIATGCAVLNLVTDVRVFAGCVTGRKHWPTVPAERVPGVRLMSALNHVELRLDERSDDAQRPVLRMARVHEVRHAPFIGFNRAQAAVVEAAVLVSRLHLLPFAKIAAEMTYLQIAIDKTAGPEEREAWGWLNEAIARHPAAASAAEGRS